MAFSITSQSKAFVTLPDTVKPEDSTYLDMMSLLPDNNECSLGFSMISSCHVIFFNL